MRCRSTIRIPTIIQRRPLHQTGLIASRSRPESFTSHPSRLTSVRSLATHNMDVGSGQELRLVNRLNESRSPYVGTTAERCTLRTHANRRSGPRTYEQPSRLAAMVTGSTLAGKAAQPTAVREHRLRRLPLCVEPYLFKSSR